MKEMSSLLKSVKKLSVLYIEENKTLQVKTNTIFKKIFNEVFLANDEQEGLKLFKENKNIDIVILDFNMTNIVDYIKDISDIDIILLSAFDTPELLKEAVNLEITSFLFKPLEEKQAINLFCKIAKRVEDKKSLNLLRVENEQNHKESCKKDIFSIVDACVLPIVIYKEDIIIYSTQAFHELITYNSLDKISLSEKKDGYITDAKEYNEKTPFSNKIKIKQKVGNRFFKVLRKDIDLPDCKDAHMYMLVDITLEEYRKVKIGSYLKALEVLSIKQKKELLYLRNDKVEDIEKVANDTLELDIDKKSTLRKRHHHIMTSAELVDSIDVSILEDLQELDDLDSDLKDAMDPFSENDFSNTPLVSELLLKYAKEIKSIDDFKDLHLAVKSLADLLYSIDIDSINKEIYSELSLYLNSIREDLASWRKNIFVEQNTDNIHYLDSSLFSTALHIELLVSEKSDIDYGDSEEDDLEFF